MKGGSAKILMSQSNKNELKQPVTPRHIMLMPADCLGLFNSTSMALQRVDMHIITRGVIGNINVYNGNLFKFKIVLQIYVKFRYIHLYHTKCFDYENKMLFCSTP